MNLAGLDVREVGGTYFGKHKEPPAKMGRHNRRKPHFSGHLVVSGSEMAEAQVGAVCEMRRRGGPRELTQAASSIRAPDRHSSAAASDLNTNPCTSRP